MLRITEVNDIATQHDFFALPAALYKNDPHYIAPLKQDIEKVFDASKNKFFHHGECTSWMLYDEQKPVGRIAAFINHDTAYSDNQPTGGCGFFECINNAQAANFLFDTAKQWLQQRGMEAMDGPINFGERNAWWGLLVEGFTPPTYQMNYNPPYYKELFEGYGFRDYFQQYSYSINIKEPLPQRYRAVIERMKTNGSYSFRHLEKRRWKKYAADFRSIYNRTWKFLPHFKEISEEQVLSIFKSMKPIILNYLCWFGYYKEEPVAMFIMLPELNGWFKYINGNLNWWGILKFLWFKFFDRSNRKIFGIVFGVVPEHQRRGVEAAIVMAADEVVRKKHRWDEIELTWVGDFNSRMLKTCDSVGGKIVKRHITYRKLFDETKEFKRHPVIE